MVGLGHGIVKGAATVPDIEDDAALFGRQRRRQQATVLDDVGEIARQVWRTRLGVGQDIARAQQIEDLGHQGPGLHTANVPSRGRRFRPSRRPRLPASAAQCHSCR
jgi:hypothetical protein